jgi:hypothetical protein
MQELRNDELMATNNTLEWRLFQEILARIELRTCNRNTTFRMALPAGMKLAFTLRYLATGESYSSLQFSFS